MHNNCITITNARSLLNLDRPLAVKRAREFADVVARLGENAEAAESALPDWDKVALRMGTKGLPGKGYMMKYMRCVSTSVRPALSGAPPTLSLARGARAGLARLTGDSAKLSRSAAESRLELVDEELRRQCVEARYEHGLGDLCAALCGWHHNGCPQNVATYENMRGALEGTPASRKK